MHLAVIPARYASSRLPGKPLAMIGSKSLIQRVYERVSSCAVIDQVVVATDDARILDHVHGFGGNAQMTSASHKSGTDRVAEVARQFPEATVVVNVQGDEPFIDPEQVNAVIAPFQDPAVDITTLAHRISDEQALLSPNVVKVVRDNRGRALYFSRHGIPFLRDVPVGQWLSRGKHLQHLGIYAFRATVLEKITALSPGALEVAESLEQLRWLQAGYSIRVELTDLPAFGVDTPADLAEAIRRIS
ncbi:3-deoxy-manno-octulosonate cytidylyltransferase [Lewinella sp. W8]|uniref:3-deoxy-manno-octulosonate cytidylyltransferase n=1 Tax=Lewinella sp. W8 TaxID=2528208 RepID=UPI00106798DA|nr:3-deoxy-manno-octulosonate cytidylyltransferase [Lewinella sp. W8]MTB53097.1 3-deoxy-manno-octulosonate cytidylyltransferase [Lewinella sp. W8]